MTAVVVDNTPLSRVDGLDELRAFAECSRRLGEGSRDTGEASTLAWAETHDAVAIVDDLVGRRLGHERDVRVHGSLWLIVEGHRDALLDRPQCEEVTQSLLDTELYRLFRFQCGERVRMRGARGLPAGQLAPPA